MKTSKRILAIVLTVIMVMSLATTAFAAMEGELTGGTITIENAVDGNTYSPTRFCIWKATMRTPMPMHTRQTPHGKHG